MKTKIHFTLVVSLAAIVGSCGQKNTETETDSKELAEDQNEEKFDKTEIEKDTEFAVAAADGGLLEVQLGQLAIANGSAGEVKKFGQSMVDDHSKANEELKELAAKKNISLPAVLSDKNQKKYEEFSKKNGTDFDKEYCDFMVKDHREDINDFKTEADKGKDPDLKAWAAGKVSTLEHHLMMAESAQSALKNN